MRLSKRSSTRTVRYCLIAVVLCSPLLFSASHTPSALELILSSGKLPILSRNGPTTYYEGSNGLDGFEYTLAKAFADHLGVELTISEEEHLGSLIGAVGSERGQIGAAGLTVTEERIKKVRFTEAYMSVTQQLIYRSGSTRPRSLDDLQGKTILVISDSAHVETLKLLQKRYSGLRWHEQSNIEMVDLIEMVHNGDIDLTIVDSNAYELNRTLFPLARVAFDLSEPQKIAWAFPKSVDNSLFDLANNFILEAQQSGLIDNIQDQYFGKLNTMDAGSALTFAKRMETRLPRWKEHLKMAAEQHQLDWQLLAAISYQESHWNPKAQSYTGVRGLMMLTLTTAKEMGIKNRLDPEQSILGGAKYLKKIYDRLPTSIQGDDRQWLTLAAYNIGFGHMEDARVLTEREGGNPDKWDDVKLYLPLLAKRKYYRTLKHGYARGWEPVTYVRNIRNYYNTIVWHQQIKQSRMATSKTESDDPNQVPAIYSEQAQAEKGVSVL